MVGTDRRSTRLLAVAGTAALVLTLTACGGSSKPAASPTSTKPAATPTTTTVANPVADTATAKALVFVPSDLPAGWVASDSQADPADTAASNRVAKCAGASDPTKQTADVTSPDFDKGNAEVGSEVTLAPSRAAFEADAKALRSSKYETCAQTILAAQLRADFKKDSPGVTISTFTVSRFSTPTYGEATAAFRILVTIKPTTGADVPLYIDLVAFGEGRAEVSLNFDDQGAPFDPALEQSLVAKAAAKLKTSAA